MNTILLRFNKSLKKITISKSYSSVDLGHLISHTFELKDRVVGLTDKLGKFYDLEFVSKNLQSFKNDTLTLVVSKELNQDNMSFASSYLEADRQDLPVETEEAIEEKQPQSTEGSLGLVEDLGFFEKLFLRSDEPTVVVKSNNLRTLKTMPCYTMKSADNAVIVYVGERKVCELYIENWANIEDKIRDVIGKDGREPIREQQRQPKDTRQPRQRQTKAPRQPKQPKPQSKPPSRQKQREPRSSKDYSFEPSSQLLDNLRRLYQSDDISELEYFKLRCQLLEGPEEFYEKYHLNEETSFESFRAEILRSKEAARLRSREGRRSREGGMRQPQRKYEIPIIIRKTNNVIQKIPSNYPISFEQQHSMNLIAELQLKGLANESEANFYKSLVLRQNPQVEQLFMDYFNEQLDQIQLSRRLKLLKRKTFTSQYYRYEPSSCQPEPLMKLLLKHSTHSNLQLLRRLTLANNAKILGCYDQYLCTGDEQLFSDSINKVASYYRIKEDLDDIPKYARKISRTQQFGRDF